MGKTGEGSEPDFVEAWVEMAAAPPPDSVVEWFTSRGISVVPARVGALASGPQNAFEAAFGKPLAGRAAALSLPVPVELHDDVRSITVAPIPGLHGGPGPAHPS
ncbi:hypothetical protein [Frankia sp. Cas3]|uniref:hypothetical protein n=1 Tax=Frankia sp. Cas3 TaxID=3073926 RepID=UPI002AD47865|nr:hypothetical protein [Frankia sp. Cas3]